MSGEFQFWPDPKFSGHVTLPSEFDLDPPISVTHAGLADRLVRGSQGGLVRSLRFVVVSPGVHLEDRASPPDRHLPFAVHHVDELALAIKPYIFPRMPSCGHLSLPREIRQQLSQFGVFVLELLQSQHRRRRHPPHIALPVEVAQPG